MHWGGTRGENWYMLAPYWGNLWNWCKSPLGIWGSSLNVLYGTMGRTGAHRVTSLVHAATPQCRSVVEGPAVSPENFPQSRDRLLGVVTTPEAVLQA